MKKKYLLALLILSLSISSNYAQPAFQGDLKELLKGPDSQSVQNNWLESMKLWRKEQHIKLSYNDTTYRSPSLRWAPHCFIYVQMMAEDRYFYDPLLGKYTVDRYLNDLKKRYGGIDAVLIWPTYPNIGIDKRNQFDLLADMPGGLQGVKQMVSDFKKRGVRVFFPIMFWDKGTRPISQSMATQLLAEMKFVGADGLNGDTMFGVTEEFKKASDSLEYPIVLQPEVALTDLKMVEWNTMSWGYYWKYDYRPGVSVYKWLEPRHQVHITNRWVIDKTDDLQYAFFNGIGYNAWENVWGIWNQVPQRFAETIRRITTIYRFFPDIWSSAAWQPYFPTLQKGVFATAFPGAHQTVYTLINRDSSGVDGAQLRVPYQEGMKYYDLWNGRELVAVRQNNQSVLGFPMEANGFGAVLVSRQGELANGFSRFLATMKQLSLQPLGQLPVNWEPLPQQLVTIQKTKPAVKTPEGMVLIPANRQYHFESVGVMVEGNDLPTAVGVQHPGEKHPARIQKQQLDIPAFYIDRYPVTNKEFKLFLESSHYHPKDDHNFLKDWSHGTYPAGWENKPVTWISLEDARAYAVYYGKRLPNEWEWQYAAQGTDGRLYPWGNSMDSTLLPKTDTSRSMLVPDDVNAFPQGASPYGVVDMIGHIWQWTNEYQDDHTRFAVLKGGSSYKPQTSDWYFPQARELNKYGKYLLMSPGKDRSANIGFRCVKDL